MPNVATAHRARIRRATRTTSGVTRRVVAVGRAHPSLFLARVALERVSVALSELAGRLDADDHDATRLMLSAVLDADLAARNLRIVQEAA